MPVNEVIIGKYQVLKLFIKAVDEKLTLFPNLVINIRFIKIHKQHIGNLRIFSKCFSIYLLKK